MRKNFNDPEYRDKLKKYADGVDEKRKASMSPKKPDERTYDSRETMNPDNDNKKAVRFETDREVLRPKRGKRQVNT